MFLRAAMLCYNGRVTMWHRSCRFVLWIELYHCGSIYSDSLISFLRQNDVEGMYDGFKDAPASLISELSLGFFR